MPGSGTSAGTPEHVSLPGPVDKRPIQNANEETIVSRTITAAVVGIGIASVSLGLLAAGLGAITSEVSGPRWIPACPISDCVAAFHDNGPIVAPGPERGSGASPTHLAILEARHKEP